MSKAELIQLERVWLGLSPEALRDLANLGEPCRSGVRASTTLSYEMGHCNKVGIL